mmetsp:Transcript_13866/g.56171  ORF Transcript_13866/g.56171 Transcript_13866/m.56171 type:complete len:201 (-) Transcript_13866:266-868(-)
MEFVPHLGHGCDRPRLLLALWNVEQCHVIVGIERVTLRRVKLHHAVLPKGGHQLLLHHEHALVQRSEYVFNVSRVGLRLQGLGVDGSRCSREVVGDVEEILAETLDGELLGRLRLSPRPLPQVFHVRKRTEEPIVQILNLRCLLAQLSRQLLHLLVCDLVFVDVLAVLRSLRLIVLPCLIVLFLLSGRLSAERVSPSSDF